jgi:maltose alpha-D-glucosyltransferase/alpha-amylase
VEAEIEATFLAVGAATIPAASRAHVDALLAARPKLQDRVARLDARVDGVVKTRYHGDLHLGQVLVAKDDFFLVDFEGEPARPLAERREKSSVLRDVAGMLRSFSYAAHAAVVRGEPGASPGEGAAGKLAEWEAGAIESFLAGYTQAARGLASVPSDAATFRATLDLFLLEKALYELRYELSNRPDWLAIPLRGLLELAQK